MSDISRVLEYWEGRVGRDLTPFADAGTEVDVLVTGRALHATWTMRGEERMADFFDVSADRGVKVLEDGQECSYRAFLVGPRMADLMSMAKAIVRSSESELFVDTAGVIVDLDKGVPSPKKSAVTLLQEIVAAEDRNATRVTVVTGEAGAGKTQVLGELVRRQAEAFIAGKTSRLLLYVNAQGRALARFSEALAVELDDLRSPLNYHHVTILARVGALVPVIDGFDELLGVSGYDDAFSSLTAFIEELDGQGQVIASARSSYYQEEFVARASSSSGLGSQAWSQMLVEVQSWRSDEVDDYIKKRAAKEDLKEQRQSELLLNLNAIFVGRAERLREKPLFIARTIDLLLKDVPIEGGDDLLENLAAAFIERERCEKLLDRNGQPLLEFSQIEDLMAELAEEMWNQETRELDRRSTREIAEYVLTVQDEKESVITVVTERMPTLAFLAVGQRPGSVTFEHELFFSHFLGRVFADRLSEAGEGLKVLLARSVLPPEVGRTAYRRLLEGGAEASATMNHVLSSLADAGSGESHRINQVRENAGRIVQESIAHWFEQRVDPIQGAKIRNLEFAGGSLAGARLNKCHLQNVQFRRTDLTRARFTQCAAHDVLLNEVVVDPDETRLELEGLDHRSQIIGMRVSSLGKSHSLYDPEKLNEVLVAVGALSPQTKAEGRNVAPEFMDLMEKLTRAYMRANPICTSDDTMRALFRDRNWEELELLLKAYGIVTVETRAAKGPSKTFLRRQFLLKEIMAGVSRDAHVPSEIRAFWEDLEGKDAK